MDATFRKRWLKPEVYPLGVFVIGAVGLAAYLSARKLITDPEVRVNKDDRKHGRLDNHSEGEVYHNHPLRRFLRDKKTQIMPGLNEYFSKPLNPSK
ncbi:hypothetical protein SELMODRAFT_76981 [Selaginella moellendorffii]|uniref:NADH-ubiquinone reductase complex 1 MLRQ subunit n=1 Tax=Selaginella moellendorffii TaxID=88036 RepID=D8QRB4_SELML|nr:hypothetical protein SELMODRAFT_76981 [Selaginella moellendorffii]